MSHKHFLKILDMIEQEIDKRKNRAHFLILTMPKEVYQQTVEALDALIVAERVKADLLAKPELTLQEKQLIELIESTRPDANSI